MTVAHVREGGPRRGGTDVAFLESARFYRVLKENPAHDAIVRTLRDALAHKRMVRIRLKTAESDTIEAAEPDERSG